MKKIPKLPSLSRVVPGSTATLELPIGPTYQRLNFQCSGTALAVAHIGRINVLINGKVVQTFKDLQRLFDLNGYYKRGTDTVTDWCIHFNRAELLDAVYRRAPGIGTMDVQTFSVEMDIAAGAPANIAISAWAEADPVPQPLGVFFKIREYGFSSAVAGTVEMDKLPRGPWYSVIHCFKSDISYVEVEADQVKLVDAKKSVLERLEKEASPLPRVPVTAKATHIDMIREGDLADSIRTDTLKDFRLKLTLDTAGAVDIVAETLDTLQGA